jgi:hypothetical protein
MLLSLQGQRTSLRNIKELQYEEISPVIFGCVIGYGALRTVLC